MGDAGSSRRATPKVALSSGHGMPVIGLGTAAVARPPLAALATILVQAMEVGYRHFDTAAHYGSEESIGRAVAEALDRHLINSRDEVFITSKLWCSDADRAHAVPALKETLGRLRLEYVDLYLIHFPVRMKKEAKDGYNLEKGNLLEFDIKGTWEAMEECSELGLAKSIGVSNFGPKKLSRILQF